MEQQIDTVNLQPTWLAVIPLLTEVALRGTSSEGRSDAMEELKRLARIGDASNEMAGALQALIDLATVDSPEIARARAALETMKAASGL